MTAPMPIATVDIVPTAAPPAPAYVAVAVKANEAVISSIITMRPLAKKAEVTPAPPAIGIPHLKQKS